MEDSYHGAERSLNVQIPGSHPSVATGTKKLKVKIPKGIKEGQKIRLGGQGGAGQIRGDLLLEVKFNRHKHFTVDGKNISLILPITPWLTNAGDSVI
ncbi:DnaJ C-terminal domain-containing protein [sulfur-oxidizing endosymbiont of Gigantopelta aegis]|uniref:DnaJ C-terminal domain-containing protein n=1 Tax=sulfur-oxidizing endosymbiont of Gigantopelta aegis TaxID=2794934 RepID=UPI0018DCD88A